MKRKLPIIKRLTALFIALLMGFLGKTCLLAQNTNPEGTIQGLFSVSDNNYVCFSQGNLQYQATTGTWRFAEHQYDIYGRENDKISETYSGWIDLFGCATSGYDHGAVGAGGGMRLHLLTKVNKFQVA